MTLITGQGQPANATPPAPVAPDDELAEEPARPVVPAGNPEPVEECPYAVVLSATSAAKPEWKAVKIKIVSGEEFAPVIADNFLLLTKPDYTPGKTNTVVFRVLR